MRGNPRKHRPLQAEGVPPLRPGTLLRLVRLWPHARKQGREIGQLYRVGYYSKMDGLDCVWLVDSSGRYDWTADHAFVSRHFHVIRRSSERSLYGSNRPKLGPLRGQPLGQMNQCSDAASGDLFRPIRSLIGKSEKAQQTLTPGTWQHGLLQKNLNALRLVSALMGDAGQETEAPTRQECESALCALADMISKSRRAQAMFAPGTSHHTLQRNRLRAFRAASSLIKGKLR